jgi:general secretion pathway protein J
MRRRRHESGRRAAGGFTLIELLVALGVLAIMLSTIYATFFAGVEAMRRGHEQDDTYQVARVVMEQISNDLAMAFYRPGSDRPDVPTQAFIGLDKETDGYARDRLDFTTASHALMRDGRPETDVVEVSYYVDETYSERPLLVRREDPLPDSDFRHGGMLRVMAENVVALNLRYREPDEEPYKRQRTEQGEQPVNPDELPQWYDAWDAAKEKPLRSLPQLVEVRMTIRDEKEIEHTFGTTVVLCPYQVWR